MGLRLELAGRQSVERQIRLSNNVSLSVDLPVEVKPVEAKPVEVVKPPPGTSPGDPKKPKAQKKVTRDGQLDPFSN